ncbi:MAG: CapA family protein [Bacilli bacterium]|nr:CapA family protein [Bacilli bacterium]
MAKRRKRRKKRRLKWKNIIIACILVIALLAGLVFGGLTLKNKLSNKSNKTKKPKVELVKPKKEEEKETSITMITAGDNLIHSSVYKDANRNAGYNGYDFKPMYELIKPIVSKYDLAYYNQESILGGTKLGLNDYPTFNSPQETGDAMIDAGFNIVSLATNHTMDSGEKAVLSSREYWDSKTDILAVGSYASTEDKNKIRIKEEKGIKYTMLNYTYGTNGMPVPSGKDYLVNVWPTNLDINDPERDDEYQEYKKQVKKDVEEVRDKVDVLFVAMHWGVEYTHDPTEYEKDMAKYLAELGVDVIIGTHPHVVQPVTWIDNTLVIYSLGNFISAQYQNQSTCTNYKCTTGLMTSFKITKTTKGKKTNIKIDDINNELIYTYYSGWANFKVIPFSNAEIANRLPGYKNIYEIYKSVVTKLDQNMKVVPVYG